MLILAAVACGSALAPGQPGNATITIRAGGMTPKEVSINRGNRIVFVNEDSQPHRPVSGPHPEHTSCPALNFHAIAPGGRVESAIINDALDCRLHDELRVGDAAFTTRVLIGVQ